MIFLSALPSIPKQSRHSFEPLYFWAGATAHDLSIFLAPASQSSHKDGTLIFVFILFALSIIHNLGVEAHTFLC